MTPNLAGLFLLISDLNESDTDYWAGTAVSHFSIVRPYLQLTKVEKGLSLFKVSSDVRNKWCASDMDYGAGTLEWGWP